MLRRQRSRCRSAAMRHDHCVAPLFTWLQSVFCSFCFVNLSWLFSQGYMTMRFPNKALVSCPALISLGDPATQKGGRSRGGTGSAALSGAA